MHNATPSSLRQARSKGERLLGIGCVLAVVIAGAGLIPGVTQASRSLTNGNVLRAIGEHANPFRTRDALLHSGLPVYDLRISRTSWGEVMAVVEQAKARGVLSDDLKQWSAAKFVHGGVTQDVKIRVRGDFANHWDGPRRSWRVRFPKDQLFQGQREINLINTTDGKAVTEYFTNAVFRELGLITLRDGYAVLRINGIPQGVYYQVEHPGSELLIHHQRSESTLFRNSGGGMDPGSFQEQITRNDAAAWDALDRLLRFEHDPAAPNQNDALEVVDLHGQVAYLAGIALFCADHTAMVTDNHRLYYDSSRGKLYPVPWDLEPTRIPVVQGFDISDWQASFDIFARWPMSRLHQHVLQNDALRTQRNLLLWSLVKDDRWLSTFDDMYRDATSAFWADVTGLQTEEDRVATFREMVRHNLQRIRRSLAGTRIDVAVKAPADAASPLASDSKTIAQVFARISVAVNAPSGVVWNSCTFGGLPIGASCALQEAHHDDAGSALAHSIVDRSGQAAFLLLNQSLYPDIEIVENHPAYLYDGKDPSAPYRTKPLRHVAFPKTGRHEFVLRCEGFDRAKSTSNDREARFEFVNAVTQQPPRDEELRVQIISGDGVRPDRTPRTISDFLAEQPKFRADPQNNRGVALRGNVGLDGLILIPGDLSISPGSLVRLGPGAAIVCTGKIIARGDADAPIVIEAATEEPWGVVASVNSREVSRFEHVSVSGGGRLQGVHANGIFFTGALAIHHGDLDMQNSTLRDNPGEDGLNVKHGTVRIVNTTFAGNHSDGVDLDFVDGEVADCNFQGNLGDGLDLSGSRLRVHGNAFRFSGDKGLSVGEQSQPEVQDSVFENNTVGVAVKDLSEAKFIDCTFRGNQVAVAVYQKKPVFGGGTATFASTLFEDNASLMEKDEKSRVDFLHCLGPDELGLPGISNHARLHGDRIGAAARPSGTGDTPNAPCSLADGAGVSNSEAPQPVDAPPDPKEHR